MMRMGSWSFYAELGWSLGLPNGPTFSLILTMKNFVFLVLFTIVSWPIVSQPIAITFQAASSQGIIVKELDSLYQSAVHVDTTLAVFKSDVDQEKMHSEYVKLLQAFGVFLRENNFNWTQKTACFNRIYFNKDGGIDYFVYNFRGQPEEKPTPEQEKEFNRLLSLFIQDYKIDLKADRPFAQCSPTTYMPKE